MANRTFILNNTDLFFSIKLILKFSVVYVTFSQIYTVYANFPAAIAFHCVFDELFRLFSFSNCFFFKQKLIKLSQFLASFVYLLEFYVFFSIFSRFKKIYHS